MILLDGQKVAEKRLQILKKEVQKEYHHSKKRPGLAVIRIGDNPASKIYVARKMKACNEVGFLSLEYHLKTSTSQKQVKLLIQKLNRDKKIHGILIQLPLPKHLNTDEILECVNPQKDVDGFHPMNLGKLLSQKELFIPCTPLGIMNLLKEYKIEISGKRAVVVGRSRIVGRPMSLLLDREGATVTGVHSQTQKMEEITQKADILVAAIGKPKFIQKEHVRSGVVIVDVGINKLPSGKIVGDVDFEKVKKIASVITPVPGGVGPMTICSLLENTWKSFRLCPANGFRSEAENFCLLSRREEEEYRGICRRRTTMTVSKKARRSRKSICRTEPNIKRV